ncbi:MLP-like protein 328 [Cucumis sativus]|uniref:Bet v I/Major latex protein domain-containing protein n=1 Tax=Cucumis sativus TaxID=3659 RepID=A0A0A0KPH8_CUCSA|nr:MLP-like protein 328 [Cucumis sativus]KGN49616.1 hypothetical protein Csa_018497 [Cucumis sativus]
MCVSELPTNQFNKRVSKKMALVGKLVNQIEIKTSAEKYYKLFKHHIHHLPDITPIFQQVTVHDGDWDSHGHGSIKVWNYTVDGKAEVFKERVVYDDKNFAVTVVGIEGDVFNHYKSFQGTYQVVPKDSKHCFAVLTVEYEKLDHSCPDPNKYLVLMTNVSKDIESFLK